ncbi:DUF983 domain-containing protein [Pelagibacterium flavum]|jgi:uncharacterized protein (DUF983 family)|uniref:DUF983 domain-containing protein n=1 Tax=Pelagibacterium flavum TaxID=2984530 RepID=A0ABY6IQ10_9HYPH|nr:DUF983 domain-containing protein [Pelagibacterium sp. YIM 151497]UYQ72653.1 DUF983 domain-containing protein [Pelagibacterium sp. YIM 151497]
MTRDQNQTPLGIGTSMRARCPRCGEGQLFKGFLTLRKDCEACGLDYSFADPADGPAFLILMVGCIPAVVFGLWLEVAFRAPIWVHLATTVPLIFLTCVPPLRPLKAWMVAQQYRSKAEEVRADMLVK